MIARVGFREGVQGARDGRGAGSAESDDPQSQAALSAAVIVAGRFAAVCGWKVMLTG